MAKISVLDTGLVYRNPKPHVHSVHAYFPSVVSLANGDLLCSLVLGEAFEAPNCHTHVARSGDGGATWQLAGPLCAGTPGRLTSDSARITALPDGKVVAFMIRADRTNHPAEGLTNPETLGFVPTETLLLWSNDWGPTVLRGVRLGDSMVQAPDRVRSAARASLAPLRCTKGEDQR